VEGIGVFCLISCQFDSARRAKGHKKTPRHGQLPGGEENGGEGKDVRAGMGDDRSSTVAALAERTTGAGRTHGLAKLDQPAQKRDRPIGRSLGN
jgi:hypothetical protein